MSKDEDYVADLERQTHELRDIIAALLVKYASRAAGSGQYRAVLNPDVFGAIESSLLLIDTSVPGVVTVRYGASRS